MFKVGDIIKGKYIVESIPSNQGGMGQVAFVKRKVDGLRFALKYCDDADDELRNRFRREVRLLKKFDKSDFVVPIIDSDLNDEPPMFVMALADMDLSKWIPLLNDNPEKQENVFLRMIDCIAHLHSKNDRHRDIKPQNFLIFGDRIVVSDLGLAKDPSSETEFTKSLDVRGTFAFSPPQFSTGGFKEAEFSDDIFMLGKSFYYMLTGLNPYYLMPDKVNPVLFRVLEKCSQPQRHLRYQSSAELRGAIVGAYDIILNRRTTGVLYDQLKGLALKAGEGGHILTKQEATDFFNFYMNESEDEQVAFIEKVPTAFVHQFMAVGIPGDCIKAFLDGYNKFLQYAYSQKFYPFGHAETVAHQMAAVVASKIDVALKAEALRIAMDITTRFSRSKAAETCCRIIESIDDDAFAHAAVDVMRSFTKEFWWAGIERMNCQHFYIVKTVKELQELDKA
jgi:serine/threonine protein kinase